jgi:DNA-binding CsgD family transcriptional regulator
VTSGPCTGPSSGSSTVRSPAARCGQRCAAGDRKNAAGTGWHALTPSEREVATLIAAGMTNSQVAIRLRISQHTVDGRLRRVFAKLGVNTRVELAAEYARVTG